MREESKGIESEREEYPWVGAQEDGAVKKNGRKRLTENKRVVCCTSAMPRTSRKHGAVIIVTGREQREFASSEARERKTRRRFRK